jgi:hypothetical protein
MEPWLQKNMGIGLENVFLMRSQDQCTRKVRSQIGGMYPLVGALPIIKHKVNFYREVKHK